MADRPPFSLAVSNFRSSEDNFESWVDLFEAAIKLGYPTADVATLESHCITWLPLKLDDRARIVYRSITAGANWATTKAELKKLLVEDQVHDWCISGNR